MKVLNTGEKLLSNYDVLTLVNEKNRKQLLSVDGDIKQQGMSSTTTTTTTTTTVINKLVSENLASVFYEIPRSPALQAASNQNNENIHSFLSQCYQLGYQLEIAELLQIVNLAPKSLVALHSCIEECDLRFSQDQLDHLLSLVKAYLLPPPTTD